MVKKLELLGRKWFERTNGNTYFSAIALYNGQEIARIDFEYGYEDQWLYEITKQVVIDQLQRGDLQPWQFINLLESQDIAVFKACENVKRKKDLKFY